MSRANGEDLAIKEDTTDTPGDNAEVAEVGDIAEQVRLAAQQHLAANPQQHQVLNAIPPQQVQAAVVQVAQANPALKRKLPQSDEDKKRQRAQRFAPELKARDAEEAKTARTQTDAFADFAAARGNALLTGAWQKHMNERMFERLIDDFGSFSDLVEFIVANAGPEQVSYSETNKTFEIMIRAVLEATNTPRATDIPAGRYTIAGEVTRDGFKVFHCGKFG